MTFKLRGLFPRFLSPVAADYQSDRYCVQPGGELPSRIEAVEIPESFEERFLSEVFFILVCLGFVTKKMAQSGVVAEDQFFKRTL